MRILIAVHGYPPTHAGGAERRAERTARGLAARGHDVQVVSVETLTDPNPGIRWQDAVEGAVRVRRLYCNFANTPHEHGWEYDNPEIGRVVASLIADWRPDVVHVFSGYLMSASTVRAATERQAPAVVSLTDYWWLCHRINLLLPNGMRCEGPSVVGCTRCHAERQRRFRLPARVVPHGAAIFWSAVGRVALFHESLGSAVQIRRRTLLAETLNQAAALIAPSRHLAETYIDHGVQPDRIHIYRQGVELDRCLVRHTSDELRFAYFGQLKYHKGIDLLLQAWSQLQGTRPRRLILYGSAAGEPAYLHSLRQAVQRLERVWFGGHLDAADVWRVLAETDVVVMPVRWYENSPNAILEAQAVGVPVIGARLGGVAEMVSHEQNGLLHRPDDAADLTRQMQRILDEPALIDQLRRHAMPFRHVDEEIDWIAALYANLLAERAASAASLAERAVGA